MKLILLIILSLYQSLANDVKKHHRSTLYGPLSHEWIPLNQTSALDYYTPYEVCRLFFEEGCNEEPGRPQIDACGIYGRGISHTNKPCSNNLGALYRHYTITSKSYKFTDIAYMMLHQGSNTLVLMGDSLTGQMYSDAFCTTDRALFGHNGLINSTNGFGMTLPHDTTDEEYQYFKNKFNNILPKNFKKNDIFFNVILIGMGTADHSSILYMKTSVTDVITRQDVKGKIVFIINFGLHLHDENVYKQAFNNFLLVFKPLIINNNKYNIYFRETSAQHFITKTGEYNGPKIGHKNYRASVPFNLRHRYFPDTTNITDNIIDSKYDIHYTCRPIPNEVMLYKQNWRNHIAHQYINEFNYNLTHTTGTDGGFTSPGIRILPWYNITAARYDYHISAYGDCTHFCFGSMMYAPIWHALGKYIEGDNV